MATLGDAFIDVHADMSPFRREVRAAMATMSKDMQQDVDKQGNQIGQRLGQRIKEGMARGLGQNNISRNATVELSTQLDRTSAARTEGALRVLSRDREVDIGVNRRSLREAENLLEGLGRVGAGVFTTFDRIFSSLIDIGERVPGSGFALVAVLIAGVTELIGLMGFLGEAALGVASTLPLIGLVGAAAIAPLVLTFSGLGDAFKALTKDEEEFRIATENLGDSTRSVFQRMRNAATFFLDIRGPLQENFFGPIDKALKDLEAGPLSTVLAAGFGAVAAAAGRFAAAFIELFEHPEAARFFQDVFRLAELTFDEIGGAIIELVGAFVNMAEETIPDVEDGIKGIADQIKEWADDLNEFVDSGKFREWLDEAKRKIEVITGLLKEFWDLIKEIVGGTSEDVEILLNRLETFVRKIKEFLETPAGQTILEGMRVALELVLVIVGAILLAFSMIFIVLGSISALVDGVFLGQWEDLNVLAEDFRTTMMDALQPVEDIGNAFGTILLTLGGIVIIIARVRGNVNDVALATLTLMDRWGLTARKIAGAVELALALAAATRGDLVKAASLLQSGWGKVTGAIDKSENAAKRVGRESDGARGRISAARDRANELANALDRAAGNASRIRTAGTGGGSNLLVADGGIFTSMQNVTIAEAGPEVVIPLTRPRRARELIAATNLMDLVQGGDGASQFSGMGSSGGGSAPSIHLTFVSDGSRAGDALLEIIRHGVRIRGGNVQTVVGQAGRA